MSSPTTRRGDARVVVVMGVAGSGKSTVGEALAKDLGWAFVDADWLHPEANVAKMRAGEPLTDADRAPWLDAVARRIEELRPGGVVVACSALKRRYREILVGGREDGRLVYLRGPRDTIASRLGGRRGHYMPASLLDSQLAALEEPIADEAPIVVSIEGTRERIVAAIVAALYA